MRPRPANQNQNATAPTTMDDCFQEICRAFEAHLHVYLIPSARPYFIECLVQHSSNKYNLTEAEKQELHNKTLSKILPEWTPIIEALDKGNMIIENAFDTEKCMSPEKIPPILDRAKQFARKKLPSNQDNNTETTFEKCWRLVENGVHERNKRVSGHEEALRKHAVGLVLNFYREELIEITKSPPVSGDPMEKELESKAVQILHTLYEFGSEAETWTNLLKEQLASTRAAIPKTEPPSDSVVTENPKSEVEQKESETISSAPCRKEAKDCSAFTLSKIENPESMKPDLGQPSMGDQVTITPDDQLTLVIHLPRGTEASVQVALVGQTSKSSLEEFPKFMAIDGGHVLVGEKARQCAEHADIGKIEPGSEFKARSINGESITLRYEEVFGLFLARCQKIVEAEMGTVASKCLIVIPIMTTTFERQAIRDSAICAGWSMELVQLVSEPAAIAFGYFKYMYKPDKNENVVVLLSNGESPEERHEEFALFTLSAHAPHVRMESVTGHLFLPIFTGLQYKLLTNHEKYWRDTTKVIRRRLQVSKILFVGGKYELEGARFRLIPTLPWNGNTIIEMALALAAATTTAPETSSGRSLMSECFQYEIKCRTVAHGGPVTLFCRGRNNKARETQQKLRVRSARKKIQFEVWNSINDKSTNHAAQYSVRSKTGQKIDSPYIVFEVDSSGILAVKPPSSAPDLLVTRLDSFNLRDEKELATSRATVCRLMTPGYGDQF